MKYFGIGLGSVAILVIAVAGLGWLAKAFLFPGEKLDQGFWGALIGAAGTIFAAVIAFIAVQRQIDQTEAQAREQKAQQAIYERQSLMFQINSLIETATFLKTMLAPFDQIPPDSQSGFREKIIELRDRGEMIQNAPGAAQGRIGDQVRDFVNRFVNLGFAAVSLREQRASMPSVTGREAQWNALNVSIKDRIEEGHRLKKAIEAEIDAKRQAAK